VAKLSDLEPVYRVLMHAYAYRQIDWRPGAVLSKPLAEAKIALITSAGFYRPDQAPFGKSILGGDWSYCEIPSNTPVESLRCGQTSDAFDHAGIDADRNLALPLDRLHELSAAGIVGGAAARHFSIMGSLSAPGRLSSRSAPEIAAKLHSDGTDAVFLTPV
jgi:D-proline reductase (dithiol) PrdB